MIIYVRWSFPSVRIGCDLKFRRNLKPIQDLPYLPSKTSVRTPGLFKRLFFPPGRSDEISKLKSKSDKKRGMSCHLSCPFQPPQTASFPASLFLWRCSKVTGKLPVSSFRSRRVTASCFANSSGCRCRNISPDKPGGRQPGQAPQRWLGNSTWKGTVFQIQEAQDETR